MSGPDEIPGGRYRSASGLDIAAAVARERILDAHVDQALDMVEGTEGHLEPGRALEIYARLHYLNLEDGRVVGTRVLARIGAQDVAPDRPARTVKVMASGQSPESIFEQIRRRLRGRSYHDLRRWIELHSGRTEVALLNIHVTNAFLFLQVLRPDKSIARAVQTYAQLMNLRKPVTEIVYYQVLDRLPAFPLDMREDAVLPEIKGPEWGVTDSPSASGEQGHSPSERLDLRILARARRLAP